MDLVLNAVEIRVLGSLVEKETTTPEYYPLSLNALVNACNQKSSRDPVLTLEEDEVRLALRTLYEKKLAGAVRGTESRVAKYEHHLQEVFNFTRGEAALLCVLLLRGAQTPGELRSRTDRLYRFEHLNDVQSALQHLMQRQPPLVKMLTRQPGAKEARYVHLLAGDVAVGEAAPPPTNAADRPADRVSALEDTVRTLEDRVAEVERQLADLRCSLHASVAPSSPSGTFHESPDED